MLTKNKIKLISSLKDKKHRQENGVFVVEGDKLVKEALSSNFVVTEVYAVGSWWEDNELTDFNGIKEVVKETELKKISNFKTPNQVLALVKMPDFKLNYEEATREALIGLDKIQDPGNLGTIIRTADWFGLKNIICSLDSVDVYNPKVVQATMGSIFRVKVFYADLKEAIKELKKQDNNYQVCGATLDGQDVLKEKLPEKAMLIFGNESQGISSEIVNMLDKKISIPRAANSQAESLNVAVSVGVLLNR